MNKIINILFLLTLFSLSKTVQAQGEEYFVRYVTNDTSRSFTNTGFKIWFDPAPADDTLITNLNIDTYNGNFTIQPPYVSAAHDTTFSSGYFPYINEYPVGFTVVGAEADGKERPLKSDRHDLPYLTGSYNSCDDSLYFTWTEYADLKKLTSEEYLKVEFYELFSVDDNKNFTSLKIMYGENNLNTSYRAKIMEGYDSLRFIIKAKFEGFPDSGGGNNVRYSFSNYVRIKSPSISYPDSIRITRLRNDNSPPLLICEAPASPDYNYVLYRTSSIDNNGEIIDLIDNIYETIYIPEINSESYYYVGINAEGCETSVIKSNLCNFLVLNKPYEEGNIVNLSWNKAHFGINSSEIQYTINKTTYINEENAKEDIFITTDTTYEDDISGSQLSDSIKYVIQSIITGYTSISNIQIHQPTSFVLKEFYILGDEEEGIIKPEIFPTPERFDMKVFNRAGVMVAHVTSNGEIPEWDGKYNGKYVPQGTYIYSIKYTSQGITKIVKDYFVLVHQNN